jgi:hypothetical protein
MSPDLKVIAIDYCSLRHDASLCKIWCKSDNPYSSYSNGSRRDRQSNRQTYNIISYNWCALRKTHGCRSLPHMANPDKHEPASVSLAHCHVSLNETELMFDNDSRLRRCHWENCTYERARPWCLLVVPGCNHEFFCMIFLIVLEHDLNEKNYKSTLLVLATMIVAATGNLSFQWWSMH